MNQTTVKVRDLAWLAGLFDGEGCLFFARRKDYRGTNTEIRCDIRICMSHHATIDRGGELLPAVAGDDAVAVYTEQRRDGKKRERPLRDATIHARKAVLYILLKLRPYLLTKALEADLAIEYLRRASQAKRYKSTERDRLLADAASGLRHGRGEARAQQLLRQVIPSQAPTQNRGRCRDYPFGEYLSNLLWEAPWS